MLNNVRAQKFGPGLRERNKQRKLQRIENAARRLFSTKGYEATTTRTIARHAGIGIGTLFTYFPEKLDLVVHLFRQDVVGAANRAIERMPPDAPFLDQIRFVVGALFDHYERHRALAKVFVKELMFLDHERRARAAEMTLGFIHQLASIVERGQARREVRGDVYSLQVAYELFGMYWYSVVLWLGGVLPDRAAVDAQYRTSLDLQMQGLAPRPQEVSS